MDSNDAGQLCAEVDGDQGGDIRDGEAISRDERLVADLRVEPLQLQSCDFALRFAVLGELLQTRRFRWCAETRVTRGQTGSIPFGGSTSR